MVDDVRMTETDTLQPEKKNSWLRDMLYPLNHAISCFITDSFIQPFTGAWVQKRIEQRKLPRKLGGIFESHDHHDHAHLGHDGEHEHKPGFGDNVKHWLGGEIIGDLTAVPLTAMVHRTMPWLMQGIRKAAEPAVGWYFRKGADHGARNWALEHNLDPQGPEALAKQKELYDYEMDHLGDVFSWNVFSTVINIEAQKKMGSTASRRTLYTGKIFGAVVSNGLLLSARAAAPRFFQRNERQADHLAEDVLGLQHEEHGKHSERVRQAAENTHHEAHEASR